MTSKYSFYFSLFRIYLFWMLFYVVEKLLFVVVDFSMLTSSNAGFIESIYAFWFSIPLDFATASYFAAISWFVLSIQIFVKKDFFNKIHKAFQVFLIVISSLVVVGNIGIYPEWRMKLNFKALEYLTRPSEVLESNQTGKTIFEVFLIAVLITLSIWVFNKFFFKDLKAYKSSILAKVIFVLLIPILIFVGMRGGVKEIPISQSQSYFSQKDVLNDLAVNSTWNLGFSTLHMMEISDNNVFVVYPIEEAKSEVEKLHYIAKDTTIKIINASKPNVLFILLESWSADLVHGLGGREGITPRFDSLINDGLFFTHLYSSGNRSQQGIASILGGFPALPITTLTTSPEKMRKTPTITRQFNDEGYFSAFYYGGQLRYGNIKAYLYHNQFDVIEEDTDIDLDADRGKLGYHDGEMFPYILHNLREVEQPFFVNYFTLSSHSPYDQPMKDVIDMDDSEDQFHNSVYYTDSCLGDFMAEAKKQPWYENTLIVIVADHSHQTYTHRPIYQDEYRRIPMLITGGALKDEYIGATYDKVCSQTDIPTTLLKQLKMDVSPFPWSKNMMNPYTPEFAYFELIQGFGWVRPEGYFAYDHFNQRFIVNTFSDSAQQNQAYIEGASYLQELFQQYIDL